MKTTLITYIIAITTLTITCSSCKRSQGDLFCVDVEKNYPVKEVSLTDIAIVTYLHPSSNNDDFLYRGGIHTITENAVIIYDQSSGSFLFFSKDGEPKSRFNRKGNGPEEYYDATHIIYDEVTDDVFVTVYPSRDFIQVYSSTGKHKRKLTLPGANVSTVVSFDEHSLLVYASNVETMKNFGRMLRPGFSNEYEPFVLISKIDGEILDHAKLPQNNIALRISNDEGSFLIPTRVIKCPEGVHLCNPETDTVFLYSKDKSVTPIICKTPSVSMLDPMVILNNCVDAGRYQFMELITLREEDRKFPIKYIMRDKNTGEMFRQKILLPEYKGKEFFVGAFRSNFNYVNGTYFELDLIELKQAYKENKLSGQLRKLVATLKEDDNNVYVIAKFK